MAQIDSLVMGFQVTQRTLEANLDGIGQEESVRLPPGGGSSVNWIAGHVLSSRSSLLEQLPSGGKSFLSGEEAELYRRGTKATGAEGACVPMERLLEGIKTTGATLTEKLQSLSEQDLEAEIDPKKIPARLEKPNLGAFLTFRLYHEAYHAGQLGLARRMLGKPSGIGR